MTLIKIKLNFSTRPALTGDASNGRTHAVALTFKLSAAIDAVPAADPPISPWSFLTQSIDTIVLSPWTLPPLWTNALRVAVFDEAEISYRNS